MRRSEAFIEKMELQNQVMCDWTRYFCNQPPVEFDTSANQHLYRELKSSSVKLEGDSDPYCSVWTDAERARVKSSNSRSFAMDARIRLDNLKSGFNHLPPPCGAKDGILYNYNCQKDVWDREESQEEEEESVLDSVELLDVEDDIQDEERWLYESPKKEVFVERSESALRWCRHVLDNPSPEMEVACRSLINRLDQRSSGHFYRGPAGFHHNANSSTSVSTTRNISDSSDNELIISPDSITTSYRLQDITDVHIMARIQEASLRQDYVSTPARRKPESPPSLSSLSSYPCPSLTPAAKQSCQSPKLTRLHQQVTQFKLLKLQNQATSPGRTRSPLQTSLRSLQAVRNSRSLDTEDRPSAAQITDPPSGASSVEKGLSCWSPSLCASPMKSNGSLHSVRDSSDRTTAVRRLLRSQSLSPCRIPHLSVHGRVFALPDRTASVAWGRYMPSNQR